MGSQGLSEDLYLRVHQNNMPTLNSIGSEVENQNGSNSRGKKEEEKLLNLYKIMNHL